MNSEITFTVGPDVSAIDAMTRAVAFVRRTLPMLLEGESTAEAISQDVLAVVTELVDITARHRCSTDLLGRIVFDGVHVTVSVGEMSGPLPAPEDEPGLYLVRGLAVDIGQYSGDEGGHVTWAAVPVYPETQ